MIITVASYKGGVGKTTTALHLAAFFQRLAPTLLVDGDAIRTSIKWSQRGEEQGLPFQVVDEKQTAIATRDGHFQHIIMDLP
jgi:chromosome partitioning protein